jgi:hypothetical protein
MPEMRREFTRAASLRVTVAVAGLGVVSREPPRQQCKQPLTRSTPMTATPDPAPHRHPSMDPGVVHAAQRGDTSAGDAYSTSSTHDAHSANIWLYAGIGIVLLVVVAAVFYVLLR